MDPKVRYSGFNPWNRAQDTGPLTDKRIARYERMGYFTPEAKLARSEARKKKALERRKGNFVETGHGLIFSPT